jgi:two-component sensor histidine kinase
MVRHLEADTPDGEPLPHDECPMAMALKQNRPIRNTEAVAERPDGSRVPFIPYPTPLRNARGELVGAVNMLVDISERKQAETSQRILLKELNHRVKNNMQMLHALLCAAQRDAANAQAGAVLAGATQRVAAMAAAQQVLYEEHQPTSFKARDFLDSVCSSTSNAFAEGTLIEINEAEGVLSNDVAMPLALILNELLTNAVKHGMSASAEGAIRVGLADEGDSHRLWVQDNGPGFDLTGQTRRRASGLGLVTGLTRQLGGTLEVDRIGGARCVVRFARGAAHQ